MFSFFKRSKSKDDADKKEKSKEKLSFSPFSKRSKEGTGSPAQASSFYGPTVECETNNPTQEPPTVEVYTKPHATNILHFESGEHVETKTLTSEPRGTEDENQLKYSLTCSEMPSLADSRPSVTSEEDCCRTDSSEVSERAGSSDRADSDFKTAPNTPVLAKHLTVVTDEVVVITHPPDPVTHRSSDVATIPVIQETLAASYLGTDLDSVDGESISEDLESNAANKDLVIPKVICEDLPETNNHSQQENRMCEEMSHELYDIAEEEPSEDEEEEQSEEEEEGDDDADDDEDSGNVTQPTIEEEYPDDYCKKNLVNQETQFADLRSRLSVRDAESNKLLCQIEDLQRDVMVKTGGMDRLQAELSAAHKESELVRKRLRKLEEDLDSFKQKNAELTEELKKRSEEGDGSQESEGFDFNRLLELEGEVKELLARVRELEVQLETVQRERDKLQQYVSEQTAEREEERRIVQEALDEATAEKEEIKARFETDFEKLRTVNTDREQQLLDDFEWKLREVEQACKKRLDEKENSAKQRIKIAEDKLKAAEDDLSKLDSLKHFEAEAHQLRGLNLEQQRALRLAERTKEQLQVSEKVLQEEVKKMKELLNKEKSALTTMQAIHNREIDEKDRKMRFRLEQQKAELNNQWEEKLRKETIRLRVELDQMNRDERRMTLEAARVEKEAELRKAREKWDIQFQELIKETEALKRKLADKEQEYKENIETVRTNADRDIFELRRKLDRIDLSYQEKIEKMQIEQEKEKERMVEESERKLQSCEQSWQIQLGSTRTTLELVKEQLKRESSEQLQAMHENHRHQLEEQWDQLMQERDEIVAAMEERHRATIEQLKTELETAYKCRNSREQELLDVVCKLREKIAGKTILCSDLTTQAESLQGNIKDLNQQVNSQDQIMQKTKEETEQQLRLMEEHHQLACQQLTESHRQQVDQWRASVNQLQTKLAQLNNQLKENNESQLVEELRRALSEKEQQVAQLSKEKHLYQLELMSRDGESVPVVATARQRRRGGRGRARPHK